MGFTPLQTAHYLGYRHLIPFLSVGITTAWVVYLWFSSFLE